MKGLTWLNPGIVYVEIGPSLLRLLHGEVSREWPLERDLTGRITEGCKATLRKGLIEALGRKRWQPRRRAWCAIGARGVSLRRLQVPRSSSEDFQRLLLLQIENEFPLGPQDLAWGYLRLTRQGSTEPEPPTDQVLVAAVRKDVVNEYAELLASCGLAPVFTVSSLARRHLCPASREPFWLLNVDAQHSELLESDAAGPLSLRVISGHVAERRPGLPDVEGSVAGANDRRDEPASPAARGWPAVPGPARIFVTGRTPDPEELARVVTRHLGEGRAYERIEPSGNGASSAALAGLKKAAEDEAGGPLLILSAETRGKRTGLASPAPWKWVAVAALLLGIWWSLPYLEAVLFKPGLAARLAKLRPDQARLTMIDREYNFLRFLRQNQPPYLETLRILSKTIPPGSALESLTMNRRGDMSLKASCRTSQEVVDFRSKLVDSGFFGSVVVVEQTPTADRQKVNFRVEAQWKPFEARQGLTILVEDSPTNAKPASPGPPVQIPMPH